MDFEWDDFKNERCFRDRGFDFAYAVRAFFDRDRIIHLDRRYSYGENRYQLMGMIDNRLFVVIYTYRKDVIRIISARKANSREVKLYENDKAKD
ncbi:BrnT family toxin [Pseudanabaena mucicola]|uniref:BrnT family toxin n=1 Tax=Pseudanabaena mucicola FACHB-723 TaxID=2692860 RepID=A0ABR7ZYE5_9CYAN|nr:BrnT family toxin [Pseudanabaena mucicola]MBD2189006.1 BrnT family toxin [Pseudanabaena mucicola FACHB-723]